MPQISVVVPLYNKAEYIRRCLDSVTNQTFTDFELIVVDDGSTDGGASLVAEIQDRRLSLISRENGGAAAARNTGIAAATTPLVAFLDADDEWMPDFLAAVMQLAKEYPEAGLYATGYRRTFDDGRCLERTLRLPGAKLTSISEKYLTYVQEGDYVLCSALAIRRCVLDHVGTFPEGLTIGEDIDLWARIALRFPVAYDARILATYHSHRSKGSFARWSHCPPYPLVARTLRTLRAANAVPESVQKDASAYIDWRLLEHAYWLLDLRKRQLLLQFLIREHFETVKARIEAIALLCTAAILPLRLVAALKWKPVNWSNSIRQYWSGDSWIGRDVITRQIVRENPAKGPSASKWFSKPVSIVK